MVSVQRELAPNMVATASYVGQPRPPHARHRPGESRRPGALPERERAEPGGARQPTCGPFAENGVFTTAAGQVINGTRTTLGPDYGTDDRSRRRSGIHATTRSS